MNIFKSGSLYIRFYKRNLDVYSIITPIALAVAAFVILPNLPYLWLNRFAPTRAMINVDYLFLGMACIFLRARIVLVLFVLFAILDAFVFISSLYHFTPAELLLSFGYARYSPLGISGLPIAEIGGMGVVIVVGAFLATRTAKTRNLAVPLTAGTILSLSVMADICNGTNTYPLFTHLPFYGRTQYVAVNVANSGLLAADIKAFLPNPRPRAIPVASASQIAFRQWQTLRINGARVNMAVILVESWGEFDGQDALNRAIASPFFAKRISHRYQVTYGMVPFKGSTTSAELRELCGIRAGYRDLIRLNGLHCLPGIFTDQGYASTGMHGFYGDMFDRKSWWPLIGIRHGVFLENLAKPLRKKKCGSAFPGLCDDVLITRVGDTLRYKRQFVYGLTINSHLPLPPGKSFDGNLDCGNLPVVLHDVRCSLAQHWRKVFDAVARNALRPDIVPTIFVIVGDHSPPLMTSGEFDFSLTQVPYIILVPRIAPGAMSSLQLLWSRTDKHVQMNGTR